MFTGKSQLSRDIRSLLSGGAKNIARIRVSYLFDHSFFYNKEAFYDHNLSRNHSTVALNAPSRPVLTNGSLTSPRIAKPCEHPGQYVLLYPGASVFPPPNMSSPAFCFSAGYIGSVSHELTRRGMPVSLNFSKSFGASIWDGWETAATLSTPSKARSKTCRALKQ